jgi:hypothetical protein
LPFRQMAAARPWSFTAICWPHKINNLDTLTQYWWLHTRPRQISSIFLCTTSTPNADLEIGSKANYDLRHRLMTPLIIYTARMRQNLKKKNSCYLCSPKTHQIQCYRDKIWSVLNLKHCGVTYQNGTSRNR